MRRFANLNQCLGPLHFSDGLVSYHFLPNPTNFHLPFAAAESAEERERRQWTRLHKAILEVFSRAPPKKARLNQEVQPEVGVGADFSARRVRDQSVLPDRGRPLTASATSLRMTTSALCCVKSC